MMPSNVPGWTRSSGDLIADRRFAYAEALAAEGDFAGAADLFRQITERVPEWPPAWFGLGKAALEAGHREEAHAALQHCLALDPTDRQGAGVLLARIGGKATACALSDTYIATLFDDYAPRFDAHLVEALAYRAPALLLAALEQKRSPLAFRRGLDLGCGTGLMAVALAGACTELIGVDLSQRMLDRAAQGGHYTSLHCMDVTRFLAGEGTASADLVIAADVFCYIPDLAPVFRDVTRVLAPGGLFAFTVQTHPGDGVVIGEDSRAHHAAPHVSALLEEAGLIVLSAEAASSRKDRGVDVPGALFVAGRG